MRPTTLLILAVTFLTSLPALAGNKKAPPAPAASSASGNAQRSAIVAFCVKNHGRKVGDGECWALANEAFKQVGARRPGRETRVWGRLLNLKRETPLPGDILECDQTKFSDGSYVPTKHTAVIIGVRSATLVRVAEQNFAGKKKVSERDVELSGLRGGRIFIYRP
jgi:hypothetical protein